MVHAFVSSICLTAKCGVFFFIAVHDVFMWVFDVEFHNLLKKLPMFLVLLLSIVLYFIHIDMFQNFYVFVCSTYCDNCCLVTNLSGRLMNGYNRDC